MKKILFLTISTFCTLFLTAQNPDGDYNPYVNNASISPSPLPSAEVNGTGTLSFTVGNNGSDPLDVFPDQYITLTISLSFGEPGNANPLLAIGGSSAGLFNWSYNSGTYTAVQSSAIPSGSSGTITISYVVNQNSATPGSNGFNVNISPAPYHTSSNLQTDDAVSAYTWTELRDYGDAPISYGSADHILDFTNYLGTLWDGEPAYQASAAADGDDTNGVDDEDGVVFPAEMRRGETANISVTVTGMGYLNAWIDWNGDGDFMDAGERVATNIGLSDGTSNLAVAVPSDAIISAPTFARFRLSSTTLSSPTGSATGGEVEDYRISILCDPPDATLTSSDADNIFCAGSSITFTAGGGTNYDFRVDGISVQPGTQSTYTTSSLTNGQVVDVIVSDAIGCSSTSSGITNAVNPLPTATLVSSDSDNIFCEGTEIIFTAGGGSTYNFLTGGTSLQSGASTTYTTSALTNGQAVYVIVSDGNGCIDTSTAITNTVNANPTADAGTELSAICQGGTTLALGGTVGGSATGGTWTSSVGGVFSPGPGTLSATWTPPAGYNGTATLTLTTTGGSCGTVSSAKSQLVNALPVVLITNPDAICAPATVDITASAVTAGSTEGLSYTYWTDPAGTTAYPTPTAATAGTYFIRGTLASTGCSSISPVIVTVNPIPATPLVTVINNCDGSSSLSTTATGTLLWSTGETTPGISVTTAGLYTVTTTVNGCISPAGSGTAAPRTALAQPVVSNASPGNTCPVTTVNLTTVVTSSTPTGGSVLYKTTNNPAGTDIPDPAAASAGTVYIFYLNQEGCYSSGTEVNVSITPCPPDLTPTLVVSPNIMHGVTDFDLIVRVTELNLANTNGLITIHIPRDPRWILTDGFVPSLTVLGSTSLNNSSWAYSSDAINHIFTSSAVIQAGGFSTFGFRVTFDPGSSRGIYTITAQLVSGGGGEVHVSNNVDSEKIDYFQE